LTRTDGEQLEGADYLYTSAEVSAALIGFAAIVIAVRQRSEALDSLSQLLVRWLVERGFAALGFSLLPVLLHYLGVAQGAGLSWSGVLLAAYLLSILIRLFRHARDPAAAKATDAAGFTARLAVIGGMALVQVLAVTDVLPGQLIGWYLLGVSTLMFITGSIFVTVITGRGRSA